MVRTPSLPDVHSVVRDDQTIDVLPDPNAVTTTVARDETPRGSVALRRRGDVTELIVNGAFVMDTVDTSTEHLLATLALERVDPAAVVVGGLGLGCTVRSLLADDRVRAIDVVELESCVVDWVGAGLVPETSGVLDDPRVRPHVADIRGWLPGRPAGSADAVLLDVDNGPGFLVHLANAEIYERPFLAEIARALRPGGVLAVWSASRAYELRRSLERLFATCEESHEVVHRDGRRLDYYLYAATKQL